MTCNGGQLEEAGGHKSGKLRPLVERLAHAAWIVPGVAALIVILFIVLGRAEISESGRRFFFALIYSGFIGLPSALVLTSFSHRYTLRMGRWILLPQMAVLLVTATVGSLAAAWVLDFSGLIRHGRFLVEFRQSYPFAVVITLLVGLSVTTYETLRHKLQAATLELRTRQMEQERAYKLLAEARLSALESRMHPHFLFNTLNSIAALIPLDPLRAEHTVSKLASLLRFSLAEHGGGLVPLAQELKIVRDYLDIEATRFGRRLRYEIDVPQSMQQVKTPPLALQCLIENSIKHVAAQRVEGTTVRVTGMTADHMVRLEVADDGPGFAINAITPEHGLGNLIARLELLFGDRGKLNVTRIDGVTVVSLEFPAEL